MGSQKCLRVEGGHFEHHLFYPVPYYIEVTDVINTDCSETVCTCAGYTFGWSFSMK